MLKLLVGYDGSSFADEAIDDLTRAGLPATGVDARVMTIADAWSNEPGEEYARAFPEAAAAAKAQLDHELSQAERCATKGCQRLGELSPGWWVESEYAAGSPYWGLITRANESQTNLIVVGSHGRTSVGRMFLGSVSHNVTLYADCSVRIGRCPDSLGRHPTESARILIGWDASPGAEAAIAAVAARQWPAGSKVRLVTALDTQLATFMPVAFPAAPWSTGGDAAVAQVVEHRELIRSQAQQALARLRVAGLDVEEPVVQEGNPKLVLLDEAERWCANSIFLGARGLSRVQRILLGSVSAAVVARAKCSVEIVRP
jgi:nucleotide-binding universal stress UspA family protein